MTPQQSAVDYALKQVGKRYQFGAAGPDLFDCSGLTLMAARAGAVTNLTHNAAEQSKECRAIYASQLAPGDIVFYYSPITHCALYIGNGRIVQATDESHGVQNLGISEYATPVAYGHPAYNVVTVPWPYGNRADYFGPVTGPSQCHSGDPRYDDAACRANVQRIQRKLVASGYVPGAGSAWSDGIYGDPTVTAVNKFQSAHRLPVNGCVRSQDWQVLFS